MKTMTIHEQILLTAENLIQTKGYNAFSYRDIAEIVGIKTASIHYYYPTKAELGKAVVKQHIDHLLTALHTIKANTKLSYKKKFILFFDNVVAQTYLSNNKMCLGGMLASDVSTLPEFIQAEVRLFFKKIEQWLVELLELGKKHKEFVLKKSAQEEAMITLALLEGSLLLSRLYNTDERLSVAKKYLLERLIK